MVRFASALALVLGLSATMSSQEGATARLEPGEFRWYPERVSGGPVLAIVNITDQMLYVYQNGIEIGTSSVSTGRPGHETPTGVFTILQKDRTHHSSTYNNAPMPNMERLTWDGIALHAGKLPGYPASHGCVRLPLEFSRLLFEVTHLGATVVIADEHSQPEHVLHPGLLLPEELADVAPGQTPIELPGDTYLWAPERALEGPVSILLSSADRRVYVFRNGELIGEAEVALDDPNVPLGTSVYVMLDGYSDQENAFVPGRPMPRWSLVAVDHETLPVARDVVNRVKLHPRFAAEVYEALHPGTTLMVTDLAATEETTTGTDFTILTTHDAVGGGGK